MEITAEHRKIFRGQICPYCKRSPVLLVNSTQVYGKDRGPVWICFPCKAWVGVHRNSVEYKPLGRLANAELRLWKRKAHDAFDQLWRSGHMTRKEAYAWLSKRLGIPKAFTHIGMFSLATCQRVVGLAEARASTIKEK